MKAKEISVEGSLKIRIITLTITVVVRVFSLVQMLVRQNYFSLKRLSLQIATPNIEISIDDLLETISYYNRKIVHMQTFKPYLFSY